MVLTIAKILRWENSRQMKIIWYIRKKLRTEHHMMEIYTYMMLFIYDGVTAAPATNHQYGRNT